MFQASVLFSSPRSRRPPAWRRASGGYAMGGQAEDQRPTLFTGRTHITPEGIPCREAETLSAVEALM
jgi:hypothetical protein